jgi:hypothetical protein
MFLRFPDIDNLLCHQVHQDSDVDRLFLLQFIFSLVPPVHIFFIDTTTTANSSTLFHYPTPTRTYQNKQGCALQLFLRS